VHPKVAQGLGIYRVGIIKGWLIGKTWYLMGFIGTK
jgi:hypothetical protein